MDFQALSTPTKMVPAVQKAFQILEVLAEDPDGWIGISELCKKINISKATAHSILNTLKAMKYIDQNPQTRQYGLGIRLLELSSAYRNRMGSVPALFDVIAKDLNRQFNETVYMAVLDGTDIIYTGKLDSTNPLRMHSQVGARLPAHATALGKCLLSEYSAETIERLYANYVFHPFTENTIRSVAALIECLETVRKEGVAYDHCEYWSDVECVSAPVYDDTGSIALAISIAQPKSRVTEEKLAQEAAAIKQAARQFSNILGNR